MIRKSTLVVAFVAALVLFGAGCDTIVTLEKPNVTHAAINDGAALRLTWTAVTDAKSYKISYNSLDTTITGTSIDVSVPTAEIKVVAVNGNDESDAATIDCGLVQTTTLTLYDKSDSDSTHPSGLAFNTDGTALALSLGDANKATLDYVVDSMVGLYNAGNYGWAQNSKGNALQDAAVTTFEAATFAPAAGNYWTGQAIAGNGVYYLWLDPTNNDWDVSDHYGKMKVESWEPTTKTLVVKLAYQKVGGLRWLVD